MNDKVLPSWRSIHFVPVNVPKYVQRAATLEADALHLDLEDSIALSEKASARARVREVATTLHAAGYDIIVRINRPLDLAVRDIEAAVCEPVRYLSLTKVHSAAHIRLLEEVIEACERRAGLARGHTQLLVLVETAAAFFQMQEIATASARIVGMMLGGEDLSVDCGAAPIEEVLRGPKQQMVMAARAAGILPFGFIGSIANFRDVDAFRAMVQRSKLFGFEGGLSVHPLQIPILNEVYGVTVEEVQHAERVLEADRLATLSGRGSCELDGKMIDAPIVERARRTLERASKYDAARSLRLRT